MEEETTTAEEYFSSLVGDAACTSQNLGRGLASMEPLTVRGAIFEWALYIAWFLAGALLASGILLSFILFFPLLLAIFGAAVAYWLFARERPGAWMLVVGAGSATALLYGKDLFVGSRRACPYSSITYPKHCGPPDELLIFVFALLVTAASTIFCVRDHLRRHQIR